MIEILTGSSEWFAGGKDADYIVFRPQEKVFEHESSHPFGERTPGEPHWCRFCYREGLTKREYFHWHHTENNWSLNFAPLITWGFLKQLDINIFNADYDDVYWVINNAWCFDYHRPHDGKYPKWLYRMYIYRCFIANGALELTDQQRQNAYDLYRQHYTDEGVLRSLYEFFSHDDELTELSIREVMNGRRRGHSSQNAVGGSAF